MDVGEVQSGHSRFWTTPQLGIPANITTPVVKNKLLTPHGRHYLEISYLLSVRGNVPGT